MKDIVGDYRERFRLQRKALRRYTALLLVLAMITTLFVNWQLHSDGIAATAQYQCNQEEHTHTADCYTKVLVCGYEEGQPEDWNATFDDSASLDESIGVDAEDDGIALFSAEPEYIYVPHEHTDDCYQEVKTLTCLEEEHVHGDDCFDPEDGSLICEQFEHVHDDSCYTTDYELVCGLEDGELVEELNPAYTAVAAFEAPVAAKPVVVSPVIEAPIHYHTDDCYEEVLTCGLEEHHHTVNCLADPLADVEDESEWLAKTSTSLSGDWSADLLTVAQSQLGYTQSEKNFEVDADDGVTVRHYTRYGEWYGNPYGEWDVMFLSYCLNYAGIPQSAIPQRAGVLALRSDLRGAGYLMDPQSIPAAQQDAIALCDEGLPEEESFADADADDLGFADGASSFCSIQPGDIVFYNTTVTETVAVDDTPAVVEDDSPDADIALLSLDPVETEPQTEQRTVTYETVGIVSDVDEDAGTLTVISGNVDGNVAEVTLNASDVTALVSVASAQAVAGDGKSTMVNPVDLDEAWITDTAITVNGTQTVVKKDGEFQDVADVTITDGDTVKLAYSFHIPEEKLTAGQTTLKYKLPDGFVLDRETTGTLYAADGKTVIGSITVQTDGTALLQLNEDINVTKQLIGDFSITCKVDKSKTTGSIVFPGGGTTIPVDSKTDLKVAKEAGEITRQDDGIYKIHYTVTVSAPKLGSKPIELSDYITKVNTEYFDPIQYSNIKLTDANGNKHTLNSSSNPYKYETVTNDSGNPGIKITSNETDGKLPALQPGQTYILEYDLVVTKLLQGKASIDNTAFANDESKKKTATFQDELNKSGNYDPETGHITWTVVIQPNGTSLNGYTFKDTLTDGMKLQGDLVITDSSNKEVVRTKDFDGKAEISYEFGAAFAAPDSKYTITYTTTAPGDFKVGDTAKNTATIVDKNNNKVWEDTGDADYEDSDQTATKKALKGTELKAEDAKDNIFTLPWSLSVSVPTTSSSIEIKDKIEMQDNYEHYAILGELQKEIEANLLITCADRTTYTYSTLPDGLLTITYYSDHNYKSQIQSNSNEDAHVGSFKLKFDKKNYKGSTIQTIEISQYTTKADVTGLSAGQKVTFTNTSGKSSASYTYLIPLDNSQQLIKMASGTQPSKSSDKADAGSYEVGSTEVTAGNGYTENKTQQSGTYIYYQLRVRPGDLSQWTGAILTDTLPDNTTYVDDSAYVVFVYGDSDMANGGTKRTYATTIKWKPEDGGKTQKIDLSNSTFFEVKSNESSLTFTLTDKFNSKYFDDSTLPKYVDSIMIRYAVKVNDSIWDTSQETQSKVFTNSASWQGVGDSKVDATVTRTSKFVEKTATYNGGDRVHYTIKINPDKLKIGDEEWLTLTDVMTPDGKITNTAALDETSIKLYSYDANTGKRSDEPLPSSSYQVDYYNSPDKTRNHYYLVVKVPNGHAYQLEYDYINTSGTSYKMNNEIELAGQKSTTGQTVNEVNAGGTISSVGLTLHKVDSENSAIGLSGATFKLEKFNANKGEYEIVKSELIADANNLSNFYLSLLTTNATEDSSKNQCAFNTLYRITETAAPAGYRIDKDWALYFIWVENGSNRGTAYNTAVGKKGNMAEVDKDSINYYNYNDSINVNVKNERSQLLVQKLWYDTDGNQIDGKSSTLPDKIQVEVRRRSASDPNSDGVHVETLTLTKGNGWTASYTIPDDKYTYFVRELDVSGSYTVIYTNNSITSGGTILVTNTERAGYELPSTGGAGTTLYTAVGGTMVLAALVCGFCQKRRRERRAD